MAWALRAVTRRKLRGRCGCSHNFHHPGRRVTGSLLAARLDGTACCTLVLFAGSAAAATVGLAPRLRLEACRDEGDVCDAAPPRSRLPSPPSLFPGSGGYRILDEIHHRASILGRGGSRCIALLPGVHQEDVCCLLPPLLGSGRRSRR